jgi:membrane-associated protein
VTPLQRLAGALADAVVLTGGFAPAVLFLATFVEYVFPPFPGDVLVVLGAWYAVQGQISWPAAFAAVTAGAVAWVDYRIGAFLGRRTRRASRRSPAAAEDRPLRGELPPLGALLILGNQFFPGVRAFVFFAGAGIAPQVLVSARSRPRCGAWPSSPRAFLALASTSSSSCSSVTRAPRGSWSRRGDRRGAGLGTAPARGAGLAGER